MICSHDLGQYMVMLRLKRNFQFFSAYQWSTKSLDSSMRLMCIFSEEESDSHTADAQPSH